MRKPFFYDWFVPSLNGSQVFAVTVPGLDIACCQQLFDDVDGLVLWC